MHRIVIIIISFISFVSCGQQMNKDNTSEKDSTVVLFGVTSYTDEMYCDSLSKHFEEFFTDSISGSYLYKGWRFKYYRAIYNSNGKLIGVKLTNRVSDMDTDAFSNNCNIIDSVCIDEYGSINDKHQSPTINILHKKGEYPLRLWTKNKLSSLLTIDHNNEQFIISLIVYQNNALKIDSNKRRIDNDMEELKKLY